jgi:hypothetical protein
VPTGQTFVDDKHLGPHPTRTSLLVLPDSFSELLRFFASEANAGKGMNGHTTNIAGGDTYVGLALHPRTCQLNVPVDAVTATASGMVTNFLRKVLMISLSKTDFPVPALPV